MKRVLVPCAVAVLCGCSSLYPEPDHSAQNRISDTLKQAAVPAEKAATVALPSAVSNSLLPPLRGGMPKTSMRQMEARFDLVVTDAPINQVLMAIVSLVGFVGSLEYESKKDETRIKDKVEMVSRQEVDKYLDEESETANIHEDCADSAICAANKLLEKYGLRIENDGEVHDGFEVIFIRKVDRQ